MTSETAQLADLVARYAATFHRSLPGHHVASPLGAWLVVALAAEAAEGAARTALEGVLGCPTREASAHARALLLDPHPAVSAAAAAWVRPSVRTPALAAWEDTLPEPVERGGIPTQSEADAWAAKRTLDLIRSFPLDLDDDTLLVLASALATKVSWAVPFDVAPASELGGSWAVERVLRSPAAHQVWVASTEAAGDVVVHAGQSRDGLAVLSVSAAPDVPAEAVLAAGHEVSASLLDTSARRSLFDLPLGDGHSWTLTEEEVTTSRPDGREERGVALLPAWRAKGEFDLISDPALGFADAAAALVRLLPPEPDGHDVSAKQVAVAAYSREGFEAAAVTALSVMRASGMPSRVPGLRRTLTARYTRPYAVVAFALQSEWSSEARARVDGPWHRVPVFSAWVAEAEDTPEPEPVSGRAVRRGSWV